LIVQFFINNVQHGDGLNETSKNEFYTHYIRFKICTFYFVVKALNENVSMSGNIAQIVL